jgi:hypothetical protein
VRVGRIDEHLGADPARLEKVIEFSEGARRRVPAFGPVIPKETLNTMPFDRHTQFLGDCETEDMLRLGGTWIGLLRGHITWDASTSPVL